MPGRFSISSRFIVGLLPRKLAGPGMDGTGREE
jgi:hypothetical protein